VNALASPVLTPDICETLRAEAFAALKSLPKRGAEIGGFLTKSASSPEDLFADGVELVPSEHLFGPSYHLSPSDLDMFRDRVENSEYAPVGYFRSSTRLEMRVEQEDIEVLRAVLPGATFIVLVRPYPNGNSGVRIFAGENLDLVSEFEVKMSFVPFPELPVETVDVERATPPTEPERQLLKPAASEGGSRKLVYLGIGAILLIAVLMFVVNTARRTQLPINAPVKLSTPATPTSIPLDLRVEKQGDNFRVTWNRNLPELKNATGILSIDDRVRPRELQLDAAQIASGSVVYVSEAADLMFRLNVTAENGRQLSESVRIVIDRPQPTPVAVTREDAVTPEIRSWASAVPRVAGYRPAIPLRRVRPEIPVSLVPRRIAVQVMVSLDAGGHVTEGHAIGPRGASSEKLAELVVDAAKQWTFEPAKVRGRGVASDYTIVYSFKPATR
jgi:hypothetical protein